MSDMLRSSLCPRCGKVSLMEKDVEERCDFCGFSGLLDVGPNVQFPLIDAKKFTEYWALCDEFREKYLNKTNPDFSQEWFDKREADDKKVAQKLIDDEQKRLEYERKQAQEEARYVPRCPTCGSPRVFNRGNGAGKTVYGLMVHKQYVCNNCGYEW